MSLCNNQANIIINFIKSGTNQDTSYYNNIMKN